MSVTCVSTYFPVKNKHDNKYLEWFKNTLSINCPYVFFTNKENIELIKSFRKDLPTYFIECEIHDFYTYKYKDRMITNDCDCPSIELNLIWNEKIFMIKKAKELNPFNSEWFMWVDAGVCIYRNLMPPNKPFPDLNKVNKLPKNKFIYTASNPFNLELVRINNHYHHIAGTSYLMHSNLVDEFYNIYMDYMDKLVDKNNIWTDQVILTHIYKDKPELFHMFAIGYGVIAKYLY